MITIGVIVAPLALSFDKRVAFHTKWKQLLLSMIPISAIYIAWDVWAAERGDWWFSPEFSGSWKLFGLPLGEWLFFFVVPYACIFIFEVVRSYFPAKRHSHTLVVGVCGGVTSVLCIIVAVVFRDQEYTVLALLSFAVWIAVVLAVQPNLFQEIHTLWFFLLSTIAFLLVNGILTGMPIVLYNSEAIWNIRIGSIPLEDLFYNIGMLGFYLVSYEKAGHILAGKRSK
jgi:lycopene cyclase domain-containing protein